MKKGQRFSMNGQIWTVKYVNYSRAHCVCEANGETLDISPNSVVELL